MSQIIPGAEPLSITGGGLGVLVLHGFTGNPSSMRRIAEAFAKAGHTVEMPLLPGHGTTVEDLLGTGWLDWSSAAEASYQDLAGRSERVVVIGLSMGGALAAWLGVQHPELAGIICINPVVAPSDEMRVGVQALVDAGETLMDGIGSDVADPDAAESAYAQTPLPPLLTMFAASDEIVPQLARIVSPMLIFTSPQDHVVNPADSDLLAGAVSGPVERVSCDRSFHVATVDFDKDLIVGAVARLGRRAHDLTQPAI